MKTPLLFDQVKEALAKSVGYTGDMSLVQLSWHFTQTPNGHALEVVVITLPEPKPG